MTFPLPEAELREAFLAACRAELAALKPGNVHVHAPGHGMEARHFEDSATAAAPWIANARLKVGARVLGAVEASLAVAGCNTNLGIVLLCVPLAAAAGAEHGPSDLRGRLSSVLAALDVDDAASVFRAIALADPAGLGTVETADVAAPPSVTLRAAMALAAGRDRIARAYVTDFEEVFEFGLPRFEAARTHAQSNTDAVTTLHMSFLAAYLDSHIARKHGDLSAERVRQSARDRESLWRPAAGPASFAGLLAFDRDLKAQGLNPGTTADFVVATLYARAIIDRGVTLSAV